MFRFRFSLRSLVLLALLAGSIMLTRYALRWGPWAPGIAFDDEGVLEELGFSSDDALIYSIPATTDPAAPAQKTVLLRDARSGRVIRRQMLPAGHGHFKFSPSGKYYSVSKTATAATPFDCNGILWRAADGAEIPLAPFNADPFFSLYHSPGDGWALVRTVGGLRLVSMPDLKPVCMLGFRYQVDDFCFSENDKHFAWIQRNRVCIFSFETGKIRVLQQEEATFRHVALSPDGTMLALCNYNYPGMLIQILDWKSNKVLDQFEGRFITIEKGHLDSVSAPFSPDGKTFSYFAHYPHSKLVRTIGGVSEEVTAGEPLPRSVTQRIGGVDLAFDSIHLSQSPDQKLYFAYGPKEPYIALAKTGRKVFEFDSEHWRGVLPGNSFYCHFGHRDGTFLTRMPLNGAEQKTRVVAWHARIPREHWDDPYRWRFLPESWLAAALALASIASLWRDPKFVPCPPKPAPVIPALTVASRIE